MAQPVEYIEPPELHVMHEGVAVVLDHQVVQLPQLCEGVQLVHVSQVSLFEDQRVHIWEARSHFPKVGSNL